MIENQRPIRAILIAGPTASGKSRLALALAQACRGVVVNADASQVYADLRVLTARPDEAEERAAPHALYGHVDAAQAHGVGAWLEDVHRLLGRPRTGGAPSYPQPVHSGIAPIASDVTPVFVGGTGLYFEALTFGLATVPAIPDEIRAKWRRVGSAEVLHSELTRRDPEMAARLKPGDPQRLMRALEVIDATGRSLAAWQQDETNGLLEPAETLRIVLAPDRLALRQWIAGRLDAMVAQGAVEEVARLGARGLDPALPVMKALGVRPFAAFARGEIGLADAIERTRIDTRRYAKRQSTWFRNRMADWLHVAPEATLDMAMAEIERRGLAVG